METRGTISAVSDIPRLAIYPRYRGWYRSTEFGNFRYPAPTIHKTTESCPRRSVALEEHLCAKAWVAGCGGYRTATTRRSATAASGMDGLPRGYMLQPFRTSPSPRPAHCTNVFKRCTLLGLQTADRRSAPDQPPCVWPGFSTGMSIYNRLSHGGREW